MKPEPPNQPEPSAPVRRFTLMTWLSIYGRDCYQDFVKESDYAKLEAALTAAQSELAELRRDKERLRSALLRVTGSLGLIIKGAGASGPGHKANYDHAKAVLDETFTGDNPVPTGAEIRSALRVLLYRLEATQGQKFYDQVKPELEECYAALASAPKQAGEKE